MRSSSTERRAFRPGDTGAWTRLAVVAALGAGALVAPAVGTVGTTGAIYTDSETAGFDVVPSPPPVTDPQTDPPTDPQTDAASDPPAAPAALPADQQTDPPSDPPAEPSGDLATTPSADASAGTSGTSGTATPDAAAALQAAGPEPATTPGPSATPAPEPTTPAAQQTGQDRPRPPWPVWPHHAGR